MTTQALFSFAVGTIASLGTFLVVSPASAVDVCTLANQPVLAPEQFGVAAVETYRQKLAAECVLSTKYQQLKMKARDKFTASPERALELVNAYQAMRFVSRAEYENAKMSRMPLALQSYSGLSNALDIERSRFATGLPLTLSDLQRINAYFPSTPNAAALGATPGQLKTPSEFDAELRRLSFEEVASVKSQVTDVNDEYTNLGFIEGGLASLYEGGASNEILSVKKSADGISDALFAGDSRSNEKYMATILRFMNEMMAQSRQGHMVWDQQLMTPGEVAFLAQKFINSVQPFVDNNERTARFVQEMILTSFALPHGSSGDLMGRDLLSTRDNYYSTAMSKSESLLTFIDDCFEKYYKRQNEPVAVAQPQRRSSKSEGRQPPPPPPPPPAAPILNLADLEYGCSVTR